MGWEIVISLYKEKIRKGFAGKAMPKNFNKLGFRLKRGRTMVAKGNPEDKKALKKTSLDSKKGKL